MLVEVCEARKKILKDPEYVKSDNSASTLDVDLDDIEAGSDNSRDNSTYPVKEVGRGPTSVLELCAAYNFMMDRYPIENYVDLAKEFLPKLSINLLNLMIENCDILKIEEYSALIGVVSSTFEGISMMHRDINLLKRAELVRKSLNRAPTPLQTSNQISLVNEDEEYIAEESVEPSNDNPNSATDDPPTSGQQTNAESKPSAAGPDQASTGPLSTNQAGGTNNTAASDISNNSNSNSNRQQHQDESGTSGNSLGASSFPAGEDLPEAPIFTLLIEKFQYLFHTFVTRRLIVSKNVASIKQDFAKLLDAKDLLDKRRGSTNSRTLHDEQNSLEINKNLVVIYESLCKTFTLISYMSVANEVASAASNAPTLGSEGLTPGEQQNKLSVTQQNQHQQTKRNKDNNSNERKSGGGNCLRDVEEAIMSKLSKVVESSRSSGSPVESSPLQASVGRGASDKHAQRITFHACRPFIQDLMLLSYKVQNITINYASMKILLDMLATYQLALDPEFAQSNQPADGNSVPSFSDELNASTVAAGGGGGGGEPASLVQTSDDSSSPTPKRLLLTSDEFNFIFKDTCWFSLAMRVLWQYLSSEPMMLIDTVELIQNMHNLTHQSLVCEDIICAALNDTDEQVAYDARRKFILLFSLMKSDRSDLNLKNREFERPLFFMLDSLTNKMDAFNCIAKDWLTQVYKFRTIARVLEPIICILLHEDTSRQPIILTKINLSSIHHTHMYLYSQVYDSQRILYALNTLWNVISTNPHQGLIRLANTSIKGCPDLHQLYVRHLNTITGNNFGDETASDARASRHPSFLELTMIICLNFLSSYYTQLPASKLSQADLHGNQKVRMLASEILRTILSNLFDAIKGCPTQPIHDMLNRCRVQEIVLQHIATLVQCAQNSSLASRSKRQTNFCITNNDQQQATTPTPIGPTASAALAAESVLSSEQLIIFNETGNYNSDDFQRSLLRLLEELMILEYRVAPPNVVSETENHSRSARNRDIPELSSNSLKYYYNILISSQRLFLSTVKAALINIQRSDLHINWLSMIESTLPISGRSLIRWISCVVSRLCDNLELISNCVLERCDPASINLTLTPKYLSILLNSLTNLVHYCILDHNQSSGPHSGQETGASLATQRSESLSTLLPSAGSTLNSHFSSLSAATGNSGSTNTLTSAGTNGPSSLGPVSHVMSNIFHVFSNDQSQESGIGSHLSASLGHNDPMAMARKEVLNKMHQIMFALIRVWKAMSLEGNSWIIIGAPADVKRQILTLLSPISLRHGTHFMNAVALVWHDFRGKTTGPRQGVIPAISRDQKFLVEIVASISELPMESVLQTTRQVISSTQDMRPTLRHVPIEVGLLQFFLAYIRLFPGSQLIECWKPLLHLLRDGLQLGRPAMPQAQFTLLALLHEFVQTAPLIDDRKDQKDLQEVAQRLIDSLITVVGARLAQTRWLRRALEVEPGPQHELSEDDQPGLQNEPSDDEHHHHHYHHHQQQQGSSSLQHEASDDDDQLSETSATTASMSLAGTMTGGATSTASTGGGPRSLQPSSSSGVATGTSGGGGGGGGSSSIFGGDSTYLAKYSVQALNALAEYLAPVLDVVYASDEKDKVATLINSIMYYVIPYLKNHQKQNLPSFLACSALLSSISGYPYTRKAWRKDALELLLDVQFFQMNSQCLEHWRVIVDHLMTHDKTTFRDFLSRMSLNQSGGALKLFASRDQESEQRAQLIKRMAFILFCSERDQYYKYSAEIQEKLIESLRDNPPDSVQSQIMLCFRVLIIRSSAHLLTPIWPYVYTEMVQGLLDIEAYIEQSIVATSAAVPNADQQQMQANLAVSQNTVAKFQLFLYTCKLLDMVLALPADSLPQFQMYRWSFIGAGDYFEPHLVRIERRLTELSHCTNILPYRNHYPILTLTKINNLLDLHPFFKTLIKVNRNEYELITEDLSQPLRPLAFNDPIKFMDAILESDFIY